MLDASVNPQWPEDPLDVEQLEAKIKVLIVDATGLAGLRAADIDSQAPLFDGELGLDSLDAIQVAIALEKTFGVVVGAEGSDGRAQLRSVKTIAALVRRFATSGGSNSAGATG